MRERERERKKERKKERDFIIVRAARKIFKGLRRIEEQTERERHDKKEHTFIKYKQT